MSMICNFRISSDSEIRGLFSHPESVVKLLCPKNGADVDNDAELDVDKAWHGIHFLLCDHPYEGDFPLSFIVSGGSPVGDVDLGYGPARVFTSAEVLQIARALEPITSEQLRSKFDSETFFDNEIYPEIWDEPVEDCLDLYVLSYFDELKAFVLKAGEEGKGLIIYLN